MKKLLIATSNKAKLVEFKKYFSIFSPNLKIVTLFNLGINGEPVENGQTFEENALLKAKFYAQKSGLLALADDGGLEIEALGGEPGVLSRRWPGYEASDEELVAMVFEKLKGMPVRKRKAQLRAVIAIVEPSSKIVACEEEKIKGVIPFQPASWIQKGYPFRAVLYLPKFKKFYQDLTDEEHEMVNHRRRMIKRIVGKLKVLEFFQ